MPSASMYASPWTYREPPPRINYPPMFSALNDITLKYCLDSRTLALSAVVLLVSWFVLVLMTCMPFWFELVLDAKDGTFGQEVERTQTVINTGLFFMREDHFDNLAFLNKFSNVDVVPKVLAFAQVCAVIGHCTITGCLAATVILVVRRFGSATGSVMTAAATTVGTIFEVLSIVFAGILLTMSSCPPSDSCYRDNALWQMIPMYTQMYRVEPRLTPYVTPSWAFYIAALGAVLCIGATVLLWIDALNLNKSVSNIRYEQLQTTMDPHEEDVNYNKDGRKFVYSQPDYYGPGVYGMQPVVPGPGYNPQQGYGVAPTPANVGFGPPPANVGFHQPGPPPQRRDYSESSYSESSYSVEPRSQGKREINL